MRREMPSSAYPSGRARSLTIGKASRPIPIPPTTWAVVASVIWSPHTRRFSSSTGDMSSCNELYVSLICSSMVHSSRPAPSAPGPAPPLPPSFRQNHTPPPPPTPTPSPSRCQPLLLQPPEEGRVGVERPVVEAVPDHELVRQLEAAV